MSSLVCIRVQDEKDVRAIIVGLPLHSHCVRAVSVRHRGQDNAHYHIVGEFRGARVDTATAWIRRLFGVGSKNHPERTGNRFLSCKAWDGSPKAISYLFHEDPQAPCVIQYGFTDEYIQMCRQMNLDIKSEVKSSKLACKGAHKAIIQEVVAHLKDWSKKHRELPQPHERDVGEFARVSHKRIFMEYMRFCGLRQVNHPGKFQIEGYIRQIQYQLSEPKEEDLDSLYRSWYSDYSFRFDGEQGPINDALVRPVYGEEQIGWKEYI